MIIGDGIVGKHAAKNAYDRLERKVIELRKEDVKGKDKTKEYNDLFLEAVNDDLNTPEAIQVVWKMLDDKDFDSKKKIILLEKFDEVLGLGIKDMKEKKINVPDNIKKLVAEREKARKDKNWKKSDEIREKINKLGFLVEDSSEGMKISPLK